MDLSLSFLAGFGLVCELLGSSSLETLAFASKFIRRSSSRLSGISFMDIQLQLDNIGGNFSLTSQCEYLASNYNVFMSKQSLEGRYNSYSVTFMRTVYEQVLYKVFIGIDTVVSSCFRGIYITDSTSFQLPSCLKDSYPGAGGSGTGAGVKIHQTLELQSYQIKDIQIVGGSSSDNEYEFPEGKIIGNNNLWVRDLGYYKHSSFISISERGDYFLSRYKTSTHLFVLNENGKYERFDLEAYLDTIDKQDQATSVQVYLGREKILCRLVCEKVSQEVKQQRLEKYISNYQKQSKSQKKWEMTTLKQLLCGYNLFITNASEEKISSHLIRIIYSLRWQIELFFKIWKSLFFIHKVQKMNQYRFECFLYGRLILILMSTEIISFIKKAVIDLEMDIEISEYSLVKIIKKKFNVLIKAAKQGCKQFFDEFDKLLNLAIRYAKKKVKYKDDKHKSPLKIMALLI